MMDTFDIVILGFVVIGLIVVITNEMLKKW